MRIEMSEREKRGRAFGRIVGVLGLATVLGCAAIGAARADNDDWRHERHGRHQHEHREREWRKHEREREVPAHYYAAPGYVYAPPPVIYARPAPPPAINFVFPLQLR
jgi:hypothetical protein